MNSFSISSLQQLLRKIPKGKVVTYSEIAKAMGNEKACRCVGTLLSKNPDPEKYPCYKVVKKNGDIGEYALGKNEKRKRLQNDGIQIEKEKIRDFEKRKYIYKSY